MPWRVVSYLRDRRAIEANVLTDLRVVAPPIRTPLKSELPDRPLRILLSCAEPSGELHGARVVTAIRRLAAEAGAPAPEIFGFGGRKLADLGVDILGDPVSRAAMGFDGVLSALPFYLGLTVKMARACDDRNPDLFFPIDSPALHLPFARIARRRSVPVLHFIPPQYWGWAPWRVESYRKNVDRLLTILPFEPVWFDRHQVEAEHVGHPLLDTLAEVPSTQPPADASELALLPGSRAGVIDRNLPWMLRRVRELRERVPSLGVCILQGDDEHRERIDAHLRDQQLDPQGTPWLRVDVGDIHAQLATVRAALSVSGTVLLDLLHHRVPTVVLYRLRGRRGRWMYDNLLSCPWFASVNLLAGREVLPEFCFEGEGPTEEVGQALLRAYKDKAWRQDCLVGLELAATRLGPAGATERAAAHALEMAAHSASRS